MVRACSLPATPQAAGRCVGVSGCSRRAGRRRLCVEELEGRVLLSHITPAVYRESGQWYLRSSLTTGQADTAFVYGEPGDVPLMGDWNGDGVKTVGVFRDGFFFLHNANTSAEGEVALAFGLPGDVPIVGDWNGDGVETIGVVRENVWYLRNSNTTGRADVMAIYGLSGDTPVVGDWDGDGDDTPGVVRAGIWHLRNTPTTGAGEIVFAYGLPSDIPIAGDWDGNGADSPGVVRNSIWHLRNSLNPGAADQMFQYGSDGDVPLLWGAGSAETDAVIAEMVEPAPGEHVIGDPGHVAIRWRSAAGTPINRASIDPSDIVIVGTDKKAYLVDESELGVWRYHYHEGSKLPPGPVTVRVPAGAVRSVDGHGNKAAEFQFTIEPFPAADAEVVADGLEFAAAMDFLPDGRMLYTEKNTGRIRIVEDGEVVPAAYVDLDVNSFRDRGLIGVAVDPEFETNGLVYASYAHSTTGGDSDSEDLSTVSEVRVSRFSTIVDANGNTVGTDEQILSSFPVGEVGIHNLNNIHFGPDGMLYLTMGELNMSSEAQSLATPMGTILRIRPDGTIPSDNPFYDDGDVARGNDDRVWAYGLRNSFDFHFAQGLLLATENGPNDSDEINAIVAGGNYGWPLQRGRGGTAVGFIDPLWQSGHDTPSPVGITLWRGEWYVGFFNAHVVRKFQVDAAGSSLATGSDSLDGLALVSHTGETPPIDLAAGPDGRLYIFAGTTLYAINPPTADGVPPAAGLGQPGAGAIVSANVGYVDIRWTDAGGSGLRSDSIDVSDVLITGVTVDSVSDLGNGLYRYRFDTDGDRLPVGRVTVGVCAGAVSDNAGNDNLQRVWSFTVA